MSKIFTVSEGVLATRSHAIMGIHDAVLQAEGAYCVTMVKAIGEAIKVRAPALTVNGWYGQWYDSLKLSVKGGGVDMSLELSHKNEKEGGKETPARFITIHDHNDSKKSLWEHRLPETRDDLVKRLPMKVFEIACPEVCETIKKIVGVDITADLREAVRQPMRRKGADGDSLAGGPTG